MDKEEERGRGTNVFQIARHLRPQPRTSQYGPERARTRVRATRVVNAVDLRHRASRAREAVRQFDENFAPRLM
jgi:hypothetical protein